MAPRRCNRRRGRDRASCVAPFRAVARRAAPGGTGFSLLRVASDQAGAPIVSPTVFAASNPTALSKRRTRRAQDEGFGTPRGSAPRAVHLLVKGGRDRPARGWRSESGRGK